MKNDTMRRSLLRRLTGAALAVVLAFAMMPVLGVESFNANAETQGDVIKDGFKLHVWGYGAGGASVAIMEYNGTAAQVKLPESVPFEGYTYPANSEDNWFMLYASTFAGNTNVTKIAIPDGYDYIEA